MGIVSRIKNIIKKNQAGTLYVRAGENVGNIPGKVPSVTILGTGGSSATFGRSGSTSSSTSFNQRGSSEGGGGGSASSSPVISNQAQRQLTQQLQKSGATPKQANQLTNALLRSRRKTLSQSQISRILRTSSGRSSSKTNQRVGNYYEKALAVYGKSPKQQTKISVPEVNETIKQREPINIFKPKEWFNLVEALQDSNKKQDKITAKRILSQPIIAVGSFVGNSWGSISSTPASVKKLIQNPRNIKKIPKGVYEDLKETTQLLKVKGTRSQAIGKIGSYIFVGKILEGGFKITGQVTGKAFTKLDPYFVGETKVGTRLKIPESRLKGSKALELDVVGRMPTESIASQLGKAGKTINAISSQADRLVNVFKTKRVIRKPIQEEITLPKTIKSLLKKFDKGKISSKELIKLDRALRKAGKKGILQRSFFADPNLRIRPSRLGVKSTKEATFKELLSGKATLKKGKPQILLFESVKIEKLPKSFKDIKSSLRKGKPLTESQTKRLLAYQQKVTGKFKPLGFVTRESEITLAPGEILKRRRKVGVTLVNGKRVPIISVDVVKPSKTLSKLIKKVEKGKATPTELKTLKKKLKKETGFDYSTSSIKRTKKYYPAKRKILSKTIRYSRKDVKYTSSGKPYIKTKSGTRFVSPKSIPKGSSTKSIKIKTPYYPRIPASPKYPPKSPPKSPPKYLPQRKGSASISTKKIRIYSSIKKKTLPKAVPTFNVYAKVGKKFVKVNKGVLTREDALNKGNYVVDNTVAKTFKLISAGKKKKVDSIRKVERNYYKRAGYKLREYRIKSGKKYGVKPKYIEKRKYGIDTKGEKKGLSVARYMKNAYGKAKITKARKKLNKNSKAYQIRMKNLKKARRVKLNRARRR